MHKREFIQRAAIQFLHQVEWDLDRAISYGEQLWKRLTERGHGAPEAKGPRQTENWYAKLQGESKRQFDAFWHAFRHKQGRDRTAMRWYNMGDLSREQATTIIDAAKAEAAKSLPDGQVRKMAEGWLTERRWEDHQTTEAKPKAEKKSQRGNDKANLTHLQKLYDAAPNDALAKQIDRLKKKLGLNDE
ncbi:MAG: hypothetical protein RPV21_10860 [Candidatus Sedimenticola sp. (ex Thyasira tokunagai)]